MSIYHTSASLRQQIAPKLKWLECANPHSEDLTAYFTVRDGVLNQANQEGRFPLDLDPELIEDFRINFDKEIISYKLPGPGDHRETIGFEEIPDKKILKALQVLKEKSGSFSPSHSSVKFSQKSKGNLAGEKILQRKTDALKGLTKEIETCSKDILTKHLEKLPEDARGGIVKRQHFIEFWIKKLGQKIQEKIEKKQKEYEELGKKDLGNPDTLQHYRRLAREQNELKQLKTDLEEIDSYALTMSNLGHPLEKYLYRDQKLTSDFLSQHMRDDILAKKQGIINKDKKFYQRSQTAYLSNEEKDYIDDAVGMVLARKRGAYIEYCRQNGRVPKKEGIEDLLLNEAIQFEHQGSNYEPKGFREGIHFDHLMPSLKQEMDETIADITQMVFEAIEKPDPGTYQPDQIENDLKAQRARLNWDIVNPVRSPRMNGLIRRHRDMLTFAAGGVAVVGAAGLFTAAVKFHRSLTFENVGKVAFGLPQVIGSCSYVYSLLPSRSSLPSITAAMLAGGGAIGLLTHFNYFDPQVFLNIQNYVISNPAVSAALFHTARILPSTIGSMVRVEEAKEEGKGTTSRISKRRVAYVVTAMAAAALASYAYMNRSQNEDEEHSYFQTAAETMVQGTQTLLEMAWDRTSKFSFAVNLAPLVGMTLANSSLIPQPLKSGIARVHGILQGVNAFSGAAAAGSLVRGYLPNPMNLLRS